MRKKLIIMIILPAMLSGCSLFRDSVRLDYLIKEKQNIDATTNPARKYEIIKNLKKKVKIKLNNVLVKDIIISNNIDYNFCVISDVTTGDKKVECFIYSKNEEDIAELEKGKSRINVTGHFSRFFSVLDDYYTKVDIVNADIDLIKGKASAPAEKKK